MFLAYKDKYLSLANKPNLFRNSSSDKNTFFRNYESYVMHKKYICSGKNNDMYSKTAQSERQKKSKNRNTQNSSKEAELKSRERTRRDSHHQSRNHDNVQRSQHLSKEKREIVSNHSGKKRSRSKNKAEVFVKEITINNPRTKRVDNLENAHKIKKRFSRSSENFNQSPKVIPEHLRREKTIHVEKMRKVSQNKSDSRNTKCMREKKHDDKEIKRHRHNSSGEKKHRNEFGDNSKQLLYCQVETNNPFRKVATNDTFPINFPLKSHKEKNHKEVKNAFITDENISKNNKTKKDILSAEIPNAHVQHKRNRPKLIVGRKPFKYSILEPSSSSDNRKNRKHHKKGRNSQKDSQVKKNKKQSHAENNSKNIQATQPQCQDKIEDDLKSYFTRIQSLIDKKIDALLQNYKSKIKLKEASEEEIVEPTVKVDKDTNRHHRHRSKSRKKISCKCSEKERNEAKLKSDDRIEKRRNSPSVERNYDFFASPTRHSSPLKRKYAVSPRFNSPFWRNQDDMQRCPSPPPKNRETHLQRSSPLIKNNEMHRQYSLAGRNEGNIGSPQRHNSPVDRRYDSYYHRSSSSGRNFHYPPSRGYYETSRLPSMPTHHDQFPGRNSESARQHNSIIDGTVGVSHCHDSIKDVKDKKHTSSKKLPNFSSASIVCMKQCDTKNSNVDRYKHEKLKASGTILPPKHIENSVKKNYSQKDSYFRVEGIEPAKLLESGNKAPKKRVSRNLECKTVSIIGIPSQVKKKSFRNVEVTEDSVERKKKTKRFKLYYQYSRDNDYFYPDSANSSEGKSVISDSLRVISDESECHIEVCKIKKEIKQSGPTKQYAPSKTTQKPSGQSCIISKRSTEGSIINRDTGKHRHKASGESKLNNIIEEKTSMSSSGGHKMLNLEIDCKYFKTLHSSSSDYGVRSKNKCNLLFQNEKIIVSERKETAVPIRYGEVNNDLTKPKRKKGLANDSQRKMHNTKQKRKEQKVKLISKSDVDISYNSLIEIKSSIESSALQKYISRRCSRTAKTVDCPKSRDCSLNIANVKVYDESQTSLNLWKMDNQKNEIKEYLQNLQKIYFGIGTRLPQNYSIKEAFNEIGLDKLLLDKSTGFGEFDRKSSIVSNKNDEQSSNLLRKIYNLIENQNRERSNIEKDMKSSFKEEKEVQAVCNNRAEKISTKDLQSQTDNFENQDEGMNKNKLIVKEVIPQKTTARDVGTEIDKNSFRNSEAQSISGNEKGAMSQKVIVTDIGIEVQQSDREKHTKCVSTTQLRKTDIAVEVDITEKHIREMLEHRHKNKDAAETSACDVGTEIDENSFRSSKANVSRSISGHQKDDVSQKVIVNDIGVEVNESDREKHTKCVSTTQIRKTDIAVEVDVTEKHTREMLEHQHKNKCAEVEPIIKRHKPPKQKSSINQFSKPNEENRPKSVSNKKRRDRPEIKKEQSTVCKGVRNDQTREKPEKPSSAKTNPLENKDEEHENRSNSCDSKSTVRSKIPTSKNRFVSNAAVDKKSKTKEKLCTQICDEHDEISKLKKSKSEISFRNIRVDAEESKITSLVCLHKYFNVIKYETSSKSNTHSLDRYPNSEQTDRSRLFLTKDYRSPEVSSYKKRKDYDESMRRKKRKKAGNQSKSNLAPQVYEVRYLTVDNLHSSLVKNKNTIENNDFLKTSYGNTLACTPPEYAYKSNIPKCFFEGSFNKTNFTKTNIAQSKLCEFYQQFVDHQGSCLSYERSNIIINEAKSLNLQGNYEHCLPGHNDVGNFLNCLCKHLISNKLADIDESFKKIWSVCDKINLKGNDSPSEEKTADSVNVSEENIITDRILSDKDPVHNIDQDDEEFMDDTEYLVDRKLVVTGNLSCPVLRAPDSSFDYLYQMGSSEKLSNMGTFVSPRKPVNTILGFALNSNTSHKRLKPLMKNSLVELDLEEPCSVESGYSSTKSKNNLSFTNFFKKPKIAALMEPQNDNWFCSDENINSKESISCTPRFTDYQRMTKQCQEYAQKVTQYSRTKISMNEDYEEIPLDELLRIRNRPNLIKFNSDSSILEKKIEAERKESIQSDPTGKQRYNHENVGHNTDFYEYELCLPSGDHIQNKNHVSVIYENMAGIHTCHVKGDYTEEGTTHKKQLIESNTIENMELINAESKTDMKLLQKILDSEVVLSSTNLNTYCITIFESRNLDEKDDFKISLSGNEVAGDNFKLCEGWNGREKHLSNCDLLDYENSRKFQSIISKKFFENLLEVYEKEIAVSYALLQDNDFLENELLSSLREKNESHTTKKKLTVKNRIKIFIRKVFGSKNRDETVHVFYHGTERVENLLSPVDADYQEKLQSLASGAHKYFSMFVQAVEHNNEINDEIKICGLLKLLERIENGHFKFLRGEETVNFEEEIKEQIKQAFIEIYCKASTEAEIMHRKLSSNDIHLIATFVCKYRIGLLSRTDIIASYIGQGFLRTDQQLKAAVIFLMKQPDIDLQEFQTYCEKYSS